MKIRYLILYAMIIMAVAIAMTGLMAFIGIPRAYEIFKSLWIIVVIGVGLYAFIQFLDLLAPKLPPNLSKIINYAHATLIEILSLLVIICRNLINTESHNPSRITNKQRPLLLIHGLYHNSSAWIEFLDRLKSANVGPVFTLNLGNPFGSINAHVKKVKNKVAEIQNLTGRKDIILVGHSMGGIVASKFALDGATQETLVTDIITMGSPLKGTRVAKYLGWGKSVKEMRQDSNFIKDLNKKIINQSKIYFFHIATETDLLIPLSSALLLENKNAKHLILPNSSHMSLLFEKKVIDSIIDYYKNRIPSF